MDWLKTGAGAVGFGLEAVKNAGIRSQIEKVMGELPPIRVSPEIQEPLNSWARAGAAYKVLMANIENNVYAADKELLVSDTLAVLARLYPDDDYLTDEQTVVDGKRKTRVLERPEVVEVLTSLLIDNWQYVNDKARHDMELVMAYAVYMVNKYAEKTHGSAAEKWPPNVSVFGMQIMILLDGLARVEQLNRSKNILVAKSMFQTYGDDEIGYIRSKLKPPKSGWQRGQYDWTKDSSCWVVTAYYGSPADPNVVLIKALRSELMAMPGLGRAVALANDGYHRLGRSALGGWWRDQVAGPRATLPRALSGMACRLLLLAAGLARRPSEKQE